MPAAWQVEAQCQPRGALPTPGRDALPLPGNFTQLLEGSFSPSSVEDLNEVVPGGAPQLSAPQTHPMVRASEPLWPLPQK
jgi:hypothetical protein